MSAPGLAVIQGSVYNGGSVLVVEVIIQSRGVAAKSGILSMNVDAAWTKVSGRSRQGGRGSGVVVKRGSTVHVRRNGNQ